MTTTTGNVHEIIHRLSAEACERLREDRESAKNRQLKFSEVAPSFVNASNSVKRRRRSEVGLLAVHQAEKNSRVENKLRNEESVEKNVSSDDDSYKGAKSAVENKSRTSAANDDKTTNFSSGIKFYHELKNAHRVEDEQSIDHWSRTIRDWKKLQQVYLFGLQKVSSLQDLRDAPDAILPGNFPVEQLQKAPKVEQHQNL